MVGPKQPGENNEQSHDDIAEAIASLPVFASEPGSEESRQPRITRDWAVDWRQWDIG
jgi:hypothetical protein